MLRVVTDGPQPPFDLIPALRPPEAYRQDIRRRHFHNPADDEKQFTGYDGVVIAVSSMLGSAAAIHDARGAAIYKDALALVRELPSEALADGNLLDPQSAVPLGDVDLIRRLIARAAHAGALLSAAAVLRTFVASTDHLQPRDAGCLLAQAVEIFTQVDALVAHQLCRALTVLADSIGDDELTARAARLEGSIGNADRNVR